MSTHIRIASSEHGTVRVFATDLTQAQIDGFDAKEALGADHLLPEQVELFDVADLGEIGLTGYLEEGHGIPAAQLADMAGQLDGLGGIVLIVPSRALDNRAQTLTPTASLRLIGTFFEESDPVRFADLPSQSAKREAPGTQKTTPSNAAISGRVAMVALMVLALLVAIMIWVA